MDKIDKRHGSPYDRGASDSYYRRLPRPHFYLGGTYKSERIPCERMTDKEVREYFLGYDENDEGLKQ